MGPNIPPKKVQVHSVMQKALAMNFDVTGRRDRYVGNWLMCHRTRVYIPYGEKWYEYSIRRLQENPTVRNMPKHFSCYGQIGRDYFLFLSCVYRRRDAFAGDFLEGLDLG